MDDFLADTTFLIDLTREYPGAVEFARRGPGARILIHPAAEAEVLVGARNLADLRQLATSLSKFRRVRPVAEDFDHCLAFIRRHALTHGIGWPDCLIAATALRLGLPVVTLNDKHFSCIRGLKVIRPY